MLEGGLVSLYAKWLGRESEKGNVDRSGWEGRGGKMGESGAVVRKWSGCE